MITTKAPKKASETAKETYDYYKKGKSIEEIAEIRDLKESTIYTHFETLILNGLVNLSDIVGQTKKKKILDVLKEKDLESLSEIKDQLDESISYGEIRCVLAFVKLQNNNNLTQLADQDIEPSPVPKDSLEIDILTVRELTRYIKNLLEEDRKLNNLFVRGEISNLRNNSSGHVYFSLKDEETQIKCVLFRRTKEKINFELEDGMNIILKGYLEVYGPRGEYSIIVEEAQPDGLGALHLAFIQLKNKLEKEGLFSMRHKKPIPKFPKTIGVVTSLSGAVLQDILNIIKKRWPLVKVVIVPTTVQGKAAYFSVIESIELINESKDVDVLILARGGGSLEDLWCFNEEKVARAVFKSRIPIISAIGHEMDFTIVDFVADCRAPTPSAAAERVVPDIKEIYDQINHLSIRSTKSVSHVLELLKNELNQIVSRPMFKKPFEVVHANYRELDQVGYKLQTLAERIISLKRKNLEMIETKIIALNPKSVLERGYSIVTKKGEVLKSSLDVKEKEDINIILHRGKVDAKVKKTYER
jgi:exodeoxyribonuclease VII large subunit